MKLALIGKDIQHSLSPEIYKELIKIPFTYELIDCKEMSDLPSLTELAAKYDGVNITSPYKGFYYPNVKIKDTEIDRLNCINCLKFTAGQVIATNTDYLALEELVEEFVDKSENYVLLGDGFMANITKAIFKKKNITLLQYSRKTAKNFANIDLSKTDKSTLVINSCAREFQFLGKLPENCTFWDYNYNLSLKHHQLSSKVNYVDGLKLLIKQATKAVDFWTNT